MPGPAHLDPLRAFLAVAAIARVMAGPGVSMTGPWPQARRAGSRSRRRRALTDRLRDLEQHGLVERVSYAEIPPRVEYSLTERGRTLEPVLSALADWGRAADVVPAGDVVPGR